MSDGDRPTSTAVRTEALRMDTITDVGAMVAITLLTFGGHIPGDYAFGAICAIAGLMKLDAVRKRGGVVLLLLGAAGLVAPAAIKVKFL